MPSMIGTALNVAGILVGGLAGLARRKPLSPANESFFKVALGAFTVFYGLRLTWMSLNGSFPQDTQATPHRRARFDAGEDDRAIAAPPEDVQPPGPGRAGTHCGGQTRRPEPVERGLQDLRRALLCRAAGHPRIGPGRLVRVLLSPGREGGDGWPGHDGLRLGCSAGG